MAQLTDLRANRRSSPACLAVAVVCIVLLAMISVVQATHLHQTASEADHCALCVAMHSAAPISFVVATVVVVQLGVFAPLVKAQAPALAWSARHVTRPPPQDL